MAHTPSLFKLGIIFAIFVAGGVLAQSAMAADITLAEIAQAVRGRYEALGAVRLRATLQRQYRVQLDRPDTLVGTQAWYTFLQDRAGRVRAEIAEQSVSRREAGTYKIVFAREILVWDGNEAKKARGTNPDGEDKNIRLLFGTVTQHSRMHFGFDTPGDYLGSEASRRLDELLMEPQMVLRGKAEFQGKSVLLVESEPSDTDRPSFVRRYIDPELGFAPVYRAMLTRQSPDGPWVESNVRFFGDYYQAREGLWLPRHAIQIIGERAQPVYASDPTVEWELDPSLDEAAFQLEFENGTLVTDEVRGKTYQHTNVNDQMIADQVAAARRLAQEQGAASTSPASARMLLAACVAVVIAAAIVVWRVKRRRKAA